MRPHISLDVRNVPDSVDFYQKVFGVAPQKQTTDYAKFDLMEPSLNLSLLSTSGRVSVVNHLGIEVESADDIVRWKQQLLELGILEKVEEGIECCIARQDKLWFTDPDGNPWEVFTVHEQLAVTGTLKNTGCCVPKGKGCVGTGDLHGVSKEQYRMETNGGGVGMEVERKRFGSISMLASARSSRSVLPMKLMPTTLCRMSGSRCSEGSIGYKIRAG